MKIGDLIQPKEHDCSPTWNCPFCQGGLSKTGLVLESWIDLDDNESVIAVFETEEMVIRKGTSTPWMNISFYEVLND